jgi:hypothetical protein
MGYRSEVAYRIVFRNKKVLNEFISLVMLKGGDEVIALKECDIELPDNGRAECYVNFWASDVKWYESYTDVQAHTWLYTYAIERFPEDCAYQFIRVGEEEGDVENEHGGVGDMMDWAWEGFYTMTTIEIPFSYDKGVGDALAVIP